MAKVVRAEHLAAAAELTRMEDAHRTIDDACQRVRATAAAWATTGDPRCAEELMPVIEGFSELRRRTLDDEERQDRSVIAEYLSPKEWRKFLRTVRRSCGHTLDGDSPWVASCLDGESIEARQPSSAICHCPLRTVSRHSVSAYMPATRRRFTGRSSARVFVVSWRCREVELSRRLTMRRCSCCFVTRVTDDGDDDQQDERTPSRCPAVTDRDKH